VTIGAVAARRRTADCPRRRAKEETMVSPAGYIKPGIFLRGVVGPLMKRVGRFPVLTVTGRSSGQPRSVPIGEPVVVNGRSYLLSGRGCTHWILNLRAAGCGTLRWNGRTRRFRAVEVSGDERDRVIEAYRRHYGKSADSYFFQLPDAEQHPTFRLDFEPEPPA
jgi:deazaflavin-dependent oxidoreductase (nitroreductase family)